MIHTLTRVKVEDLPHFLGVFATQGALARREHGSQYSQVYRVADAENEVVILTAWESREAFEVFQGDPDFAAAIKSEGAGDRPEFTVLEELGEFPA